MKAEYTASEVRALLQKLFPHRKLVLSQFTFFNHCGVSRPSGSMFRRGRRCYLLEDVLPIAAVLALKERGIPLKNIMSIPAKVREVADSVLNGEAGWRVSGFGDFVALRSPEDLTRDNVLDEFLDSSGSTQSMFWSFDLSNLGYELVALAEADQLERQVAA